MQIGGVVGVIKSIQRGATVMSGTNNVNQTISSVNMAKSNLHILGVFYSGSSLADVSASIKLTSSTNIAVDRGTSGVSCSVSWELVEYY